MLKIFKTKLLEVPDVIDVYDLHVWSISSSKIALSVHVITEFLDNKKILCNISKMLKEKFDIHHSTIQIEPEGFDVNECSLNHQ